MIHDNADEVIENIFESLLNRYQTGLETSVRGSRWIPYRSYWLHKKPKNNSECHQ